MRDRRKVVEADRFEDRVDPAGRVWKLADGCVVRDDNPFDEVVDQLKDDIMDHTEEGARLEREIERYESDATEMREALASTFLSPGDARVEIQRIRGHLPHEAMTFDDAIASLRGEFKGAEYLGAGMGKRAVDLVDMAKSVVPTPFSPALIGRSVGEWLGGKTSPPPAPPATPPPAPPATPLRDVPGQVGQGLSDFGHGLSSVGTGIRDVERGVQDVYHAGQDAGRDISSFLGESEGGQYGEEAGSVAGQASGRAGVGGRGPGDPGPDDPAADAPDFEQDFAEGELTPEPDGTQPNDWTCAPAVISFVLQEMGVEEAPSFDDLVDQTGASPDSGVDPEVIEDVISQYVDYYPVGNADEAREAVQQGDLVIVAVTDIEEADSYSDDDPESGGADQEFGDDIESEGPESAPESEGNVKTSAQNGTIAQDLLDSPFAADARKHARGWIRGFAAGAGAARDALRDDIASLLESQGSEEREAQRLAYTMITERGLESIAQQVLNGGAVGGRGPADSINPPVFQTGEINPWYKPSTEPSPSPPRNDDWANPPVWQTGEINPYYKPRPPESENPSAGPGGRGRSAPVRHDLDGTPGRIEAGGMANGTGHFVVLTDYDEDEGTFQGFDPAEGDFVIDDDELTQRWVMETHDGVEAGWGIAIGSDPPDAEDQDEGPGDENDQDFLGDEDGDQGTAPESAESAETVKTSARRVMAERPPAPFPDPDPATGQFSVWDEAKEGYEFGRNNRSSVESLAFGQDHPTAFHIGKEIGKLVDPVADVVEKVVYPSGGQGRTKTLGWMKHREMVSITPERAALLGRIKPGKYIFDRIVGGLMYGHGPIKPGDVGGPEIVIDREKFEAIFGPSVSTEPDDETQGLPYDEKFSKVWGPREAQRRRPFEPGAVKESYIRENYGGTSPRFEVGDHVRITREGLGYQGEVGEIRSIKPGPATPRGDRPRWKYNVRIGSMEWPLFEDEISLVRGVEGSRKIAESGITYVNPEEEIWPNAYRIDGHNIGSYLVYADNEHDAIDEWIDYLEENSPGLVMGREEEADEEYPDEYISGGNHSVMLNLPWDEMSIKRVRDPRGGSR